MNLSIYSIDVKGKIIAFSGLSGSGKSTMAKLLSKEHFPDVQRVILLDITLENWKKFLEYREGVGTHCWVSLNLII